MYIVYLNVRILTQLKVSQMSFPYPTVALEEHWFSKAVGDYYASKSRRNPYEDTEVFRSRQAPLSDIGDGRIKSMDECGVTTQVISHAANSLALDDSTCLRVNDEAAQATKNKPGRLVAFATLPMIDPPAASKELRRCVKELNFVGALIDNTCEGRFYDDEYFWSVFQTAQDLDVPIYIHPSINDQVKPLLYEGNYSDSIAQTLSMHAFGWHSENALHIIRLYAAGLFERFPQLKIIIGHDGEMLPFQLDRIDRITSQQWPMIGFKSSKTFRQVWEQNIWVTTSGMFALAPFALVMKQCKLDHILYSIDYPFVKNEWGLQFLIDLKNSGTVTEDELQAIAYKNAEGLLGIKAG